MARGGYRPGAGRPKGSKNYSSGAKIGKIPADVIKAARKSGVSPLEYMLAVMNDPRAEKSRRDRMAIAAAPFVHSRGVVEPEGKKAQRQADAVAAQKGTEWADLLQTPAQ